MTHRENVRDGIFKRHGPLMIQKNWYIYTPDTQNKNIAFSEHHGQNSRIILDVRADGIEHISNIWITYIKDGDPAVLSDGAVGPNTVVWRDYWNEMFQSAESSFFFGDGLDFWLPIIPSMGVFIPIKMINSGLLYDLYTVNSIEDGVKPYAFYFGSMDVDCPTLIEVRQQWIDWFIGASSDEGIFPNMVAYNPDGEQALSKFQADRGTAPRLVAQHEQLADSYYWAYWRRSLALALAEPDPMLHGVDLGSDA